jgi:hypothetical protein
VNYDTAWTYVYDGGKDNTGNNINDIFYDVKCLTNGVCVCVGMSGDTFNSQQTILAKFDTDGKILQRKLFSIHNNLVSFRNQYAHSLFFAQNGDFIIGGRRWTAPFLMRTDSLGNLKWATWYYDSTKDVIGNILKQTCTINSLAEDQNGRIVCAAGDEYPFNGGNGDPLTNYAAFLAFDSLGKKIRVREWNGITGYRIGGFSIATTKGGEYLLSGNEAVFYLDTINNMPEWQTQYTFDLAGTGTQVNNVFKTKVLRDNTPVVMGQAYEGNCWIKYQKLYYDAWWSPIRYTSWDTAGYQGENDALYDFAQLKNGNLVFVGTKGNSGGVLGVWIIVTDSSGKKMLWEKQCKVIPDSHIPMAVCATPDDGFTMVGGTPGDAFIAHFIPKPVSAVVSRNNSLSESMNGFSVHVVGAKLIVSVNAAMKNIGQVSLFDISGKRIAMQTVGAFRETPLSFDVSKLARGTYVVRVGVQTLKICLNR